MSRFSVCDFSPNGESIYFNGIYDTELNKNYLIYDKKTGECICAHCRDSVRNLYGNNSKTNQKS